MGLGSNSVDFIRSFFRTTEYNRPPFIPVVGHGSLMSQAPYFGYGLPSGSVQGLTDYLRMDSDLVARYVDAEDQDDSPLVSCIDGDTIIDTEFGKKTIAELASKYADKKFAVLAYDKKEKKFVAAWAHSPRKTKTDKTIKIVFDDGSHLICTPDHKILNRDGAWVAASDLIIGSRVMPGTVSLSNTRGYYFIINPEQPKNVKHSERAVEIHKLYAKLFFNDYLDGNICHHKNGDKKDNRKNNLEVLTRSSHARHHVQKGFCFVGSKERMNTTSKWVDSEMSFDYSNSYGPKSPRIEIDITDAIRVIKESETIRQAASLLRVNETTLSRRLLRNKIDYRKIVGTDIVNHKIVSIEDAGIRDVYDLTTDVFHNFVANGIVVHNSALDVYADDSTQTDTQHGNTVWVEAEDEDIRKELDNLLHKRLKIEENIWAYVRTLCKYGNNFLESVVKDRAGVIAVNLLPPPTMRRIEIPKQIGSLDPSRELEFQDTLGFVYDPRGAFKISTNQFVKELRQRSGMDDSGQIKGDPATAHGCAVFENWEVTHMRLVGKNPMNIYGYGIGDPARWIFKRLVLLEDSIVMHRLSKAPSRYAFYVDVSQIPPQETSAYLNKVKQSLKKQNFVNPSTNKLDMRWNPIGALDDFFLPVRDGKESTRVESLSGPIYDHIEDIKFFENKLFAALKVPKPFLTYEESTAKTNLSAEDARFARTVLRVQREARNGLKKICKVHLSAKGINPDAVEFDIGMTIPSAIFELAQLEIRKAELELADAFGAWAPQYWIKSHVLGFSDEQIKEMERMKELEDSGQSPVPAGSSSGAIERALAGRGERKTPVEMPAKEVTPPTPPEVASRRVAREKLLMNGVKRNTEHIMERIEELRTRSKDFDRKWGEITGFMKDFQQALGRRR